MQDITVEELKGRLDAGEEIVIIDVREPFEYEEYNIGAENIPLGSLMSYLDDLGEYLDRELVLHCRSGRRSEAAKQLLRQFGFAKTRNLLGGMLEWQAKFG